MEMMSDHECTRSPFLAISPLALTQLLMTGQTTTNKPAGEKQPEKMKAATNKPSLCEGLAVSSSHIKDKQGGYVITQRRLTQIMVEVLRQARNLRYKHSKIV